jgi:hypothetical protein
VIKIPKVVQDWLYMDQWPAFKRDIQLFTGPLAGSGCSYSYRANVVTIQSSWGSVEGNLPYYGVEVKNTNRYLFAPFCATDQTVNWKQRTRLGFSTKSVFKLYAFGMSTQFVINIEPFKVPACGAKQPGFLLGPYVGVGWDAADGHSYNVFDSRFPCLAI